MSRRHRSFVTAIALAVGATLVGAAPLLASMPSSQPVTVPTTAGQTTTVTWTGTIPPGANPTSACTVPAADATEDHHTIDLTVPPGTYNTVDVEATFTITWDNALNDEILTVEETGGMEIASSDGGSPQETVVVMNLPDGSYDAVACAFAAATPQDYDGSLTLTAVAKGADTRPASAPANGLAFSASVPADIQRDEGEPLIEIDNGGKMYTCGPTGASQLNEYAQVSTDGGDQFHLLGEPPRGQVSDGPSGGDCALATSPTPNDQGDFTLSYAGLGALVNFATFTSDDGGRTLTASPISESVPGVDRQWTVATDSDTVFLNYNQVFPRAVTVQRSDDGGLTYGPPEVISPNPRFPGPLRSIPAEDNPAGNGLPVVYYPWTQGTNVRLAISLDEGDTWNNCTAAATEGVPGVLFPVADHDRNGNIYLVYGDEADFKVRVTTLRPENFDNCLGGTNAGNPALRDNPGFSAPVVVDRDAVRTAVFPWITAGGAPGRVAVAFYGTETSGRADSPDEKTWNVYVNQSLNALSTSATFSQVKATTHPNHYDQICLFGLACSAGGDRSLVDFFAIDYNPVTREVAVVYNRAHKRPGDTAGLVSTPVVFHQIAGPSNGGGTLTRTEPFALRTGSADPTRDALSDYSSLGPPAAARVNIPAADFLSHAIGPELNFGTGRDVRDGGFTVTMKLADLSDTALLNAAATTNPASGSLLWIFRFVDGYRYAAASARWNPVQGFTFAFNGYQGGLSECGSPPLPNDGDQCLYYTAETPLEGRVDQEAGTIQISVPRDLLTELVGSQGPGETPDEVPARPGARIYTAAAFSQGNVSPSPDVQAFLLPLDNTPAMDFRLPRCRASGLGGACGN